MIVNFGPKECPVAVDEVVTMQLVKEGKEDGERLRETGNVAK